MQNKRIKKLFENAFLALAKNRGSNTASQLNYKKTAEYLAATMVDEANVKSIVNLMRKTYKKNRKKNAPAADPRTIGDHYANIAKTMLTTSPPKKKKKRVKSK